MICFPPEEGCDTKAGAHKFRCLNCIRLNHPFKVKDDEAMTAETAEIKQYGVLVPAIARPATSWWPDTGGTEPAHWLCAACVRPPAHNRPPGPVGQSPEPERHTV